MRFARSAGAERLRLDAVLAVVTGGVYLLTVTGATTALIDGGAACATWPACDGEWLVGPDDAPALLAAWAHRVVTLLVGGLLLGGLLLALVQGTSKRVIAALGAATVLYPVQTGLGAVAVTRGATPVLAASHLVVAMAIFSAVLLALLFSLEAAAPTSRRRTNPPDAGSSPMEAAAGEPVPSPSVGGRLARARAYVELTKPKLWWLLCLVALAAMGVAGGQTLDPGTVVATLTGGVLAIGASGTFNNVLERDRDRRMARTADRPLVEGRIPPRRAVLFGIGLAAASTAVFVAFVNVLAAALGVLAILFYSVGYTLVLKPNTTQNIVIGGAVGAFPALIGWAAVTDTIGMPALVLGGVVFLWTPAHFYNLALLYADDYARAGFPMLPVIRGVAVTRRHILLYLGATMLAVVVLGTAPRLGALYAGTATVVGMAFLWAVIGLFREGTERAAGRTFLASNAYLGTLLLAVVIDTIAL